MYPFIPTQSDPAGPAANDDHFLVDVVVRGRDLRTLGLEAASDRLRMNVADLDVVHEARARADLRFCPFCPSAHAA